MRAFYKFIVIFFSLISLSHAQTIEYEKGELIVRLNEGADIESLFNERSPLGLESYKLLSRSLNVYLVNYDTETADYASISKVLNRNPDVNFSSRNRIVHQRSIPNDEHFDKQWNLTKIQAEKAWDVTTGGTTAEGDEIVVAILDSGYKTDLPDLFPNILRNIHEADGDANNDGCPGICGVDDDLDGKIDEDHNGREPGHPQYDPNYKDDDDENGYIDDANGLNLDNYTDNHPQLNHGTAVAGIIGAAGNNRIGVAGINWNVKLLLLSEVRNVGQIIEAYDYVYEKRRLYNTTNGEKGAFIAVTNFSSGIDNEFGYSYPAWCEMYELLGSVGILSVGATTNKNTNVDQEGDMPTTCPSEYLIAVTNINKADQQPSSGYGVKNIDLGAPGNGAITLGIGETDNIGEFSGTSSAAPHVAGAIALLHSIPCEAFIHYFKEEPSRVIELKEYLLKGVRPVSDLANRSVTEGTLDLYKPMVKLRDFCPTETTDQLNISNVYPNPSSREVITIEYNGPDEAENYQFLIYDSVGKLVYSKDFIPPLYGKRVMKFTPREMASGTYVFVIKNSEDIVAKKHVFVPNY